MIKITTLPTNDSSIIRDIVVPAVNGGTVTVRHAVTPTGKSFVEVWDEESRVRIDGPSMVVTGRNHNVAVHKAAQRGEEGDD